jgi:integrase
MSASHSTSHPCPGKPAKPRPDFPLFPHARGYWAKKIRGKLYYFGPWSDPDGALAKYLSEKDDLHAGRTPDYTRDGLTIWRLCAKFLETKTLARNAGELSPRSLDDYDATCERVCKAFGKNRLVPDLGPDDFQRLRAKLVKLWGPVRVGNEVNRIRVVFSYAWKNGLVDRPVVYGEGFKRPPKKTLRAKRQQDGPRMFEAAEIRRMLDAAGQPMRAMILMGVNCGFGNGDVGRLPKSAVDLAGGWVTFPRPKTAVARRCPLWPETIAALRDWMTVRPTPKAKDHAGLVFTTQRGLSWYKDTPDNPISKETRKLLDELGIGGLRNFYALRHTFQSIGDGAGDFLAVRSIMGYADGQDIAGHYRERMADERLRKVTEHVRVWLFGQGAD